MAATAIAAELVKTLTERKLIIATAESCTGGLVAGAITDIDGSSVVFERGIISYANSAKTALLDVRPETLEKHGAVSEEVAAQMAEGACIRAGADIAVAVTGIAGPTGGTKTKPVGLVYIAVNMGDKTEGEKFQFSGSRHEIRAQAVAASLKLALSFLGNIPK
ncbi:MAG: CinA family protein [Alphaproteobacteria bacterium]|nr:CinA family protein [Alphaproteobacteria bacterium]